MRLCFVVKQCCAVCVVSVSLRVLFVFSARVGVCGPSAVRSVVRIFPVRVCCAFVVRAVEVLFVRPWCRCLCFVSVQRCLVSSPLSELFVPAVLFVGGACCRNYALSLVLWTA
ncbi:hypothetical protein TRVL_04557 [Trypanosoma vivax]|nr:hypothetical protein TRVL_04557 [Trypanosoma vivax]